MSAVTVLLASSSPQRKTILAELGVSARCVAVDVDEVTLATPEETVRENAQLKARAALTFVREGELVVAADTVVAAGGKILGKPHDVTRAVEYLHLLNGARVDAYTGVCVVRHDGGGYVGVESAGAQIRPLSDAEISWYVATGEPLSRAGAIGISRIGEVFVERLAGAYSCFAGLPKAMLMAQLGRMGVSPFNGMPQDFNNGVSLLQQVTLTKSEVD